MWCYSKQYGALTTVRGGLALSLQRQTCAKLQNFACPSASTEPKMALEETHKLKVYLWWKIISISPRVSWVVRVPRPKVCSERLARPLGENMAYIQLKQTHEEWCSSWLVQLPQEMFRQINHKWRDAQELERRAHKILSHMNIFRLRWPPASKAVVCTCTKHKCESLEVEVVLESSTETSEPSLSKNKAWKRVVGGNCPVHTMPGLEQLKHLPSTKTRCS